MLRSITMVWLVCLFFLTGCGGLSVHHLPRQQWKTDATQTLRMRCLSFQYQVVPVGDEVGVVAEAFPDVARLPDWASWYGEAVISVYLADSDGRVLASSDTILLPRPLNREAGLPLEARFNLGTARHQPLFVSFGYRLVLTDAAPDEAPTRRTLITESALEK